MTTGFMVLAAVLAVTVTDEELRKMVAADVAKPVRPPAANGGKFWNMNAVRFMYPPAFELPVREGAVKYRYHIFAKGRSYAFDNPSPHMALDQDWLWKNLPPGRVTVIREAINRWQFPFRRDERTFWKAEPYEPGAYPPAPRSAREAVRLGYDFIWRMPSVRYFAEHGRPDPSYHLNCYPAKMQSALIRAYLRCAELNPTNRAAALKLAAATADYLIGTSLPEGTPLAGFAPTYAGTHAAAGMYRGMNMLSYSADVGVAYLKVARATGEKKYLEAAVRIAERYLALQGEDGTWFLKVREKDGKPVNPNRLLPDTVIRFLDALAQTTGETKYRAAADRAFAYFENGPMKDWNWEGQFEDAHPSAPYENLTKHPACSTAQLILSRKPRSDENLAAARELLRWSEDQFVCWRQPGKDDRLALYGRQFVEWIVEPAVIEQYYYRVPVDASAAKLVNTYLAIYRAEGNPLDLAKARTLGDSIIRSQRADGSIPTLWPKGGDSLWINCMIASLEALENLADAENNLSMKGKTK